MWVDLYDRHDAGRALGNQDALVMLQGRLRRLVQARHCEARYLGKLDYKRAGRGPGRRQLQEIWVKGDGSPVGEPIPLTDLTNLREGDLSIWAIVRKRENLLQKFTIRLRGTPPSGERWMASVELDAEPAGGGACGHALIHCHVGPGHDSLPEVRVPMPALKPWHALDWVLSQVIPDWEPCSWPDALAERERRQADDR